MSKAFDIWFERSVFTDFSQIWLRNYYEQTGGYYGRPKPQKRKDNA